MRRRGIIEDCSIQALPLKGLNAVDRSSFLSFGPTLILNCYSQTPMAPGLITGNGEGRVGSRGDDHLPPTTPRQEAPNGHGHANGNGNGHVDGVELLQPDKLEPIAVVGLALRFPQDATSPEEFWQMLLEGKSALTDVPHDRYHVDAFYKASANKSGTACDIGLIPFRHLIAHRN